MARGSKVSAMRFLLWIPALAAGAVVCAQPAEFRLKPGRELSITVDPAKRLRPANKLAGGISIHKVSGWVGRPYSPDGQYTVTPGVEQAIRDLKLPLTRLYALGDERFPERVVADTARELAPGLEAAIDRAAEVTGKFAIPQETVVLEFETQSARTMLSPEVWARGVRHSVSKGYRFRYWEIGNEPYMRSSIFKTPADYVSHFKAVSAAIKAAQPQAKTVISTWRDDPKWAKEILSGAAGHYDLVAPHWYTFVRDDFEETVIGDNFEMANRIANVNEWIRTYNPGRDVAQYDTEWGMLTGTADGKRGEVNVRNSNVLGTLYRAVRLIYYAREPLVQAASGWEMFCRAPSYGCCVFSIDAENKRSMFYWLHYYFNRHVGDWTVAGSGTAPHYTIARAKTQAGKSVPETPALITVSDDGTRLYSMLVNGSWTQPHPASLTIKGFRIARCAGSVLTSDDLDAIPFGEKEQDFVRPLKIETKGKTLRFLLPAHSVAFLAVDRSGRRTRAAPER